MTSEYLDWPPERAGQHDVEYFSWHQPGSNLVLDLHGNPIVAGVTLLSDGNHHMALEEALQRFNRQYPEIDEVFFVTLPPRILLQIIEQKEICPGNVCLPVTANLILSPLAVLEQLSASAKVSQYVPFMKNRGSVLLVPRGNPGNICAIDDLFRDDVRLFISNPETEKISHRTYRDTLVNMASQLGLQSDRLAQWIDDGSDRIVYGQSVHHREAPQALFSKQCDVAIVYYHLALRYCRIFPDQFEFIPLGGTVENPQPAPENVTSEIYMGLIADGGEWGKTLYDFLQSQTVRDVYQKHGLRGI